MSNKQVTVAVVLASANRAPLLAEVLRDVRAQTLQPDHVVVSVPDAGSLPPMDEFGECQVVHASGLAAQRNAGLDAVPHVDLVFFFDDDAVVRQDYLERAVGHFVRNPGVVGLTGNVLLDGSAAEEVGREEALRCLRRSETPADAVVRRRRRTLYGCNFAYRVGPTDKIRFDDRLPLYSWLEDHDFARRLMRSGELVWVEDCVIVHRGAKSGGRQAHRRLGYSQVMNPAYLHSVGSFPLWLAVWETVPRTTKNVLRSVAGGQRTWRRERLRGNLMAASDVLRRRYTPERIREIES